MPYPEPSRVDEWSAGSADGGEPTDVHDTELEQLTGALLARLPGFLYTLDRNLVFTSSRGAGLSRIHVQEGELVGRRVTELWRTDKPEYEPMACHLRALDGHVQHYRDVCFGRVLEYEIRPLRGAGGKVIGVIGVGLDVTEREAARHEEAHLLSELVQARKVEALGQLASSVAHDFNNLLTCIMGSLALIERHARGDANIHRFSAEASAAVDRAADLTRQLLTFGRKQSAAPRPLHVGALIERTRAILCRLVTESIQLEFELDSDLWGVRADPNQIEQAIINLVINARDAIGEAGTIRIATRNVHLSETPPFCSEPIGPGDYVELSVEDTGTGIAESLKARLFQPFFTTKDIGHGTGLGLFAVASAAHHAGGAVALDSELGRGSSFRLYFPAERELRTSGELVQEPATVARDLPTGSETILVVEDEPLLLELATVTLQKLGYQVLPCRDASEALLSVERHPGPIELIFTDVVMPEMSGKALVERIVSRRPETRALFCSGYGEAIISSQGIAPTSLHYLEKPYRPGDLARKIRSILDEPKVNSSARVPSSPSGDTVRP